MIEVQFGLFFLEGLEVFKQTLELHKNFASW